MSLTRYSIPVSLLGPKGNVMHKILLLSSNNLQYFSSLAHALHPLRICHDLSSLTRSVYSDSVSFFFHDLSKVSLLL